MVTVVVAWGSLNLVISLVVYDNLKSHFSVKCCSAYRLNPTAEGHLPIEEHFVGHFLISVLAQSLSWSSTADMHGEQLDFVAFWKMIAMVVVEWVCTWGWREAGIRESQCRFWRIGWKSQRTLGCPCAPSFLWQQCPLSYTSAMPAACLCAVGGRCLLQEQLVGCSSSPLTGKSKGKGKGKSKGKSKGKGSSSGRRAFLLLLTVCCDGWEAMLEESSAFLSSSRVWTNSLEQTQLLALGMMPVGNDGTAVFLRLLLQHHLTMLKAWPAAPLVLILDRIRSQTHC